MKRYITQADYTLLSVSDSKEEALQCLRDHISIDPNQSYASTNYGVETIDYSGELPITSYTEAVNYLYSLDTVEKPHCAFRESKHFMRTINELLLITHAINCKTGFKLDFFDLEQECYTPQFEWDPHIGAYGCTGAVMVDKRKTLPVLPFYFGTEDLAVSFGILHEVEIHNILTTLLSYPIY